MEKRETIFETQCGSYDSKHINNTTPKPMPKDLLDKFNEGVVTTEMIDEFIKQGYDIYKYRTQITIHGIANPDEVNNYASGYKSVIVNKNGSIGVRWVAIDAEKKDKIAHLTYPAMLWRACHDSQDYYFRMADRITKENYEEVLDKHKQVRERINKDLFAGSVSTYTGCAMGFMYLCTDLCVSSIYEQNVNTLAEQMTGMTIAELQAKREEMEEESRKRNEEWHRQAEEARQKRAKIAEESLPKAKERLEEIKKELVRDGFRVMSIKDVKKGDELFVPHLKQDRYGDGTWKVDTMKCKVTMKKSNGIHVRYGYGDKGFLSDEKKVELYIK